MGDYTWASVLGMYLMMTSFVVVTAWALVRAIRNGSVSFDETPKYRMLDDDGLLPEERVSTAVAPDPAPDPGLLAFGQGSRGEQKRERVRVREEMGFTTEKQKR